MFSPLQQVYIDSLRNQISDLKSKTSLVIPHTLPNTLAVDKWWDEEWNRLHVISIHLRNEFFADYCEEIILKAKKSYYDTGKTIMSDEKYDGVERKLKLLRPKSKVLEKVGH